MPSVPKVGGAIAKVENVKKKQKQKQKKTTPVMQEFQVTTNTSLKCIYILLLLIYHLC